MSTRPLVLGFLRAAALAVWPTDLLVPISASRVMAVWSDAVGAILSAQYY
jgi:hypothetical protein